MKKTYTNAEIFNIAHALLGENCISKRMHLKTCVAVRHMLKINTISIAEKYKIVDEEITDSMNELMSRFVELGMATTKDEEVIVLAEYVDKFKTMQQEVLNDISRQTMDVDVYMVSRKDMDKYFEINDGELTEFEMDVLDMFVEDDENE